MATVAEFAVEPEDLPLGRAFEGLSGLQIELERVVPTNAAVIPYLWVRGAAADAIEALPGVHPDVGAITIVDTAGEAVLVKLDWDRAFEGVVKAIVETDVTLLAGHGTDETWTFEIRGDTRGAVSAFRRRCREYGVPVTLKTLHSLTRTAPGVEHDLTEAQHEALVLAYERGYFQSPREASLAEIAEELGITGQSLGSRIRRGTRRLVGSALIGE